MPTTSPIDGALLLVLLVSAATDLKTGRILNVVTYPAIAGGVLASATGVGPDLSSSIGGLLLGGGLLYSFFTIGWMGGGDVKLMAGVGALKGFPFIIDALFYSIFTGGVAAAVVLIWRGQFGQAMGDLAGLHRVVGARAMATAVQPRGGTFPFGVAICAGTAIALFVEWSR